MLVCRVVHIIGNLYKIRVMNRITNMIYSLKQHMSNIYEPFVQYHTVTTGRYRSIKRMPPFSVQTYHGYLEAKIY